MATWRSMSLVLISLLLMIVLLPGCGVPREEYDKIERDLGAAQVQLSQVTSELTRKNAEVQQLDGELTSSKNQYNDLQNDYNELENRYDKLEAELTSLNNQYDALQNNYDELYNEYLELLADYTSTLDEYISALEELGQSLQAPYTAISGREITWAWKDIDGNIQKWTLTVDGYRGWIELPEPNETVLLQCDSTTFRMVDFRPYVRTEGFSIVIPGLYQQCADEMVFAKEIFNLVTQLTVYSEDIGEVPRWPVETLTEAGGDCEDLAILFASLIKAAPYPYDLELVYMDADNPTDPQIPNHVIVKISTDDWTVFAECTSDQGWDYYERVVGWYYEL